LLLHTKSTIKPGLGNSDPRRLRQNEIKQYLSWKTRIALKFIQYTFWFLRTVPLTEVKTVDSRKTQNLQPASRRSIDANQAKGMRETWKEGRRDMWDLSLSPSLFLSTWLAHYVWQLVTVLNVGVSAYHTQKSAKTLKKTKY
jgi:hypothetical protein